jgi:uncharacterized protein YbjQ (UPF0145 family)
MNRYEKIGYACLRIVAVRFVTAPVMQGFAELLAYGTAVKLVPAAQ